MLEIIGLISSIVAILSSPGSIRIYSSIAVAVLIVLFSLNRISEGRKKRTVREIDFDLKLLQKRRHPVQTSELPIRHAKFDVSVRLINDIQHQIFGEDAWSVSKDIELWKKYKNGYTFIEDPDDGTIKAFMSFWPINSGVYKIFKLGNMTDDDLLPEHVVTTGKSRCWWIGSIYVEPTFRKRYPFAAAHLVHGTFAAWGELHSKRTPVMIVSTGWSREGRALLHKYGFAKVSEDENPVYVLECYISDLMMKLDKLNSTLK